MGTIVDGMEYWEATTVERDESSEDEPPPATSEEIRFLKHKNRYLEHDLRKAEDKNVQLYNEIDFLKNHIENLKERHCNENDDLELETLLREQISSLEDSYAKLRVKYKKNRNEIKELKRQLTDFGVQSYDRDTESVYSTSQGDASEKYVELEKYSEIEKQLHQQNNISNQLQEQNDKNSEEIMKQEEKVGRLEIENASLIKELTILKNDVTNEKNLTEEVKLQKQINEEKIKEQDVIISELQLNITEKDFSYEKLEKDANDSVDQVIRYLNETEINLELKPDSKMKESAKLEDKMTTIPISLAKINEKIKEILLEKSDYDSNDFETTTSNSNSIEEIHEQKSEKGDVEKSVSFDPNIINKIVKEGTTLGNSKSSLPDKNYKDLDSTMKHIKMNVQLKEEDVHKQVHSRKLGVPGLLRSVSHDVPKLEDTSSFFSRQAKGAQTMQPERFGRRSSLTVPVTFARRNSLTIKKDILNIFKNDETCTFPPFPALLVHLQNLSQDNRGLPETEADIEKEYALFSLAIKSDRMSLLERVGGQRLQRNATETSIEQDISQMKSYITSINQNCDNSDMREKIMKIEKHLNVLHQSAGRVSAAAESYGAVQIESKVQNAVGTMVKHINNLRFSFEKNQKELNEMKNLLKEYSLMEEEEDFHDQAKKRNYSTSVINDYLPEADFPTSSLQIIHDEEESEVFDIEQDVNAIDELDSHFPEEHSSFSNSSPPSRRESHNSTSDMLHVNSVELSPTARRFTVGWLTEIEVPTWLDLDKLPEWDNFLSTGRFLIAMALLFSAIVVLWSTFFK